MADENGGMDVESVTVTVTFGAQTRTFTFPADDSTVDDLTLACEDAFNDQAYNWATHKFIAPQPVGLIKAADRGDTPLVPSLAGKKVRLMTSRLADVDAFHAAEQSARRRDARRAAAAQAARRHHAALSHRPKRKQPGNGSHTFTFWELRPLPYLPRPEVSLKLLERLRDDPGIRSVMNKRRLTVYLLTEMDPAAHTDVSHEGVGRTLGLNRNKGEVIELRLRTDAGDGYRDYKTIRKTLCHELAHNKFGPHDRDFWDLCHAIEREVAAADWSSGGRTVGDGPGFADEHDEEDEHAHDHGGWTGGQYVLGGSSVPSSSTDTDPKLSRREILANAAEERHRRHVRDVRERQARHGQETRDPEDGPEEN